MDALFDVENVSKRTQNSGVRIHPRGSFGDVNEFYRSIQVNLFTTAEYNCQQWCPGKEGPSTTPFMRIE